MTQLQATDLHRNPHLFNREIALKDDVALLARLHLASDEDALGRYFTGLSAATRRVYGPHAFTVEQAQKFCREIDYAHTLRFVAETAANELVAYFVLRLGALDSDIERYARYGHPLAPDTDCTLAPSVADAYQEKGLGSALLPCSSMQLGAWGASAWSFGVECAPTIRARSISIASLALSRMGSLRLGEQIILIWCSISKYG